MKQSVTRGIAIVTATLFLTACMQNPAYREGRELAADGMDEQALAKYRVAALEEPTNPEYRATYLRLRDRLLLRWLDQAANARRTGQDEEAERLYRRILEEDPANAKARNGINDLVRDVKHRALLKEADAAWIRQDAEGALTRLRQILSENPDNAKASELRRTIDHRLSLTGNQAPSLSAAMSKPITIEFKDAPLKQIFEVLSRTSGLNFVFDKDIRGDQRATIFLRSTSIRDALNLLLLTNQLEQRVLDSNSVLIFPNTAAKLKDYQELTVKTFFLTNVDAKTAAANLKTIVRSKDIVVDEKQNIITMRDTPDAVRMAEKLLALHDMPEPEVMLEVEILEISRSRLMNLGIQWPDQLTLTPLAGASGNVTLADLRNFPSDTIGASLSPMTVNAKKTDGDVNVLANPRIRARNREAAKVLIGERVPNITTTSTSTGFVAENIQYVDVGLKLEVQPTVYADNEVAIKIALEVSNIVDKVQTKTGALAYQIGTRNASTLLRLKDGENQVLAGLIRDEERSTGNRLPGFGDIPLIGRLFGSQRDETIKSEIILSITPRLIRDIRRPNLNYAEFDSGSESMMRVRSEGAGYASASRPSKATSAAPALAVTSVTATEIAPIQSTVSPGNEIPPLPSELALIGPNQAKPGTELTIQLAMKPGEPVTSIPLAMQFDPKVLEVVHVMEGDFLKQGQGATSFSNRVDKNNGQIFATITKSGQGSASAPGNLLSVTFRVLQSPGESKIQVTTVSPIGVGGRSVNMQPPQAKTITVAP